MAKKEAEQAELPEVEGPKLRKKVTGIEASAAISIVSESNPKREGSRAYEDWKVYADSNCTTVQEAYDAGLSKAHIAYDFMHGFITCEGAEVVEYEVTPRAPKDETEAEAEVELEGEDTDGF